MQEWAQGRPARQLGSYEAPLYAHSAMTSTRTVTTAPAHLQAMLGGRSQGAYWTPPGPFTAGHPVRHQAPGLYDSLRSALGPRFASADTPLPNTLTPRPAATDNPLHDTLAQRFAAMEVSPHGATPEEEQAGLPALMAAGLELQDPEPEPAKRKGGRKKAPDPPLDMDPKLRRRKIKNRESAARSKLKQKAEQAAARAAGKSIPKKQKLAATAKPTKRSASGARSAGRKRKAEPGPNATQHTLSAARTDMHPEVHPGQVFDGVPIGLPEAPIMGPPAQLLGPPMAPGPQAPCMERHQAYTDDQLLAWMRCLLDEAL
ncbi:hypothetical protein CVIRNUC_007688 [Coccomyxa viridis]|uniref:BZIP domain-containing protein n=1 Tax=Coccomyxa viridis TaxID=1274662 RepID=A0AAV1IAU0_9CHLO|nr:hypothetical protein CVIRNUC_007688 [Coccomyxa viridis]